MSEEDSVQAQDRYFINCGSSGDVTDHGRTFTGDVNPTKFFRYSDHRSYTVEDKNPSANPLYKAARVFKKLSTYVFDISQGTHILRFHFYAFSSSPELANAQFNVSASGHMLLPGFIGAIDAANSPVLKEFFITVNNTGKLHIQFVPSPGKRAFINAIEVLSTSQNITGDTGTPLVTPSGSRGVYNGKKSEVLETLYRLNVGGPVVNDTNYWRTWIPDDPYLINTTAAKNDDSYGTNLNYLPGQASVEDAPNDVYVTAKTVSDMDSKFSRVPNITWRFNVSTGSRYFVRVHFCDIISQALGNYAFNLYIYNKFSRLIDPYTIVDTLVAPFCVEYIVESDNLGFLNISIGPVDDRGNKTYFFLNGLEIMKVKNETASDDDINPPSHVSLIAGLVGAGVGVALLVILVLVVLFCWKKRKSKPVEAFEWALPPIYGGPSSYNKIPDRSSTPGSNLPHLQLGLKIPFVEIQQVTKNFDANLIIGEGGFGKVYKGTLKDGSKVAVKRSNPDHGQGLPEFQTEIMILSKIRHRHLVSLIGYCYEDGEMILVYEFMEKGTLRDHLYGSKGSSISSEFMGLSWKKRVEICIGAAKGLHYLHTGSDRGIIHRDVKSTNILLDQHYVAKVADFGLSRSGQPEQTHVSTDVKGTLGYLDPEYITCFQLTEKSDVYSFGVVLLEVLCARTVIDTSLPREQVNLADWAMRCHKEGRLDEIIDPLLAGEINPNSLKKFGETAEKCLKDYATDRPQMSDVFWDLEYVLQLQKTGAQREVQDDSMAGASFNVPLPAVHHFNSQSFDTGELQVEKYSLS